MNINPCLIRLEELLCEECKSSSPPWWLVAPPLAATLVAAPPLAATLVVAPSHSLRAHSSLSLVVRQAASFIRSETESNETATLRKQNFKCKSLYLAADILDLL